MGFVAVKKILNEQEFIVAVKVFKKRRVQGIVKRGRKRTQTYADDRVGSMTQSFDDDVEESPPRVQ